MYYCLHFAIFLLRESEEFRKETHLLVNTRFLDDFCNLLIIKKI